MNNWIPPGYLEDILNSKKANLALKNELTNRVIKKFELEAEKATTEVCEEELAKALKSINHKAAIEVVQTLSSIADSIAKKHIELLCGQVVDALDKGEFNSDYADDEKLGRYKDPNYVKSIVEIVHIGYPQKFLQHVTLARHAGDIGQSAFNNIIKVMVKVGVATTIDDDKSPQSRLVKFTVKFQEIIIQNSRVRLRQPLDESNDIDKNEEALSNEEQSDED